MLVVAGGVQGVGCRVPRARNASGLLGAVPRHHRSFTRRVCHCGMKVTNPADNSSSSTTLGAAGLSCCHPRRSTVRAEAFDTGWKLAVLPRLEKGGDTNGEVGRAHVCLCFGIQKAALFMYGIPLR